MAYFQGGDYVELLSAQGKAPASTWKMQGKIVKAFDKTIKGNAFQMDGSSETKMQLPKTMTASSSSLGLTQRFLVFQLLVPHTRSFSVEIGFSDFQTIRRRLVFSSAFRDMAATTLHVQIPISNNVPRDQWMNFVFDLQALTEHYFPGSSFKSMESICISGSCRLKRIFTMKDAPYCQTVQDNLQVQQFQLKQHRLQSKDPSSIPTAVGGFAEMKDIPKQFVFSASASNLPIPTEYFLVSFEREGTSSPESAVAKRSQNKVTPTIKGGNAAGKRISDAPKPKSAPAGGNGQLTTHTRTAVDRPENRPISSAPSRVPAVQEMSRGASTGRRNYVSSPDVSPSKKISPVGVGVFSDGHRPRTSMNTVQASPFEKPEHSSSSIKTVDVRQGGSSEEIKMSFLPHDRVGRDHDTDNTAVIKRKKHRQDVLSEIQSKLNELTQDGEVEEERDRALFMSRISLGSGLRVSQSESDDSKMELLLNPAVVNTSPPPERPQLLQHHGSKAKMQVNGTDLVEASQAANQIANSASFEREISNARSKSLQSSLGDWHESDNWHESDLLRSPEPMVLRRVIAAKKPDIYFSSSIFSFDRSEPSRIISTELEVTSKSTTSNKNLFDWDSLLDGSNHPLPKADAGDNRRFEEEFIPIIAQTEGKKEPHGSARIELDQEKRPGLSSVQTTPTENDRGGTSSVILDGINGAIGRSSGRKQMNHERVMTPRAVDETINSPGTEGAWDGFSPISPVINEQYKTCTEENQDLLQTSYDFSLSPMKLNQNHPDEERLGQLADQESPRPDSEDSFSFDVTDREAESDQAPAPAESPSTEKNTSGLEGDELDEEGSFDFDDLFEPSRQKTHISLSNRDHNMSVDSTVATHNDPELKSPKLMARTSPTNQRNAQMKGTCPLQSTTVATTVSPLRKSATKQHSTPESLDRPSSSRMLSSSDRRLASLLESTDWSQLPLSSKVASSEPIQQPRPSKATMDHSLDKKNSSHRTSRTSIATSSSLELIYDPILRCYYDPVGKKYYTLAK